MQVGTDAVISEPINQTVPVIGRFVARQAGVVAARINGPVAKIRAEVGDRVKAGDIIAVLVDNALKGKHELQKAEEQQFRAAVGTDKARLKLRRQELKRLEGLIKSAAFSQARHDDKRQDVIRLESEKAEAKAGLDRAWINLKLAEINLYNALIRAPYDGVVDKLAFATIGGVIRPAEEIMEIVPDRDEMLVEGSISPADVDQVRVGQPARVRFSSVSSSDTPEVRGRLMYVGANRVTDPDGRNSYYPVRIALDPADVKAARNLVMKPGMPAELFVETGRRSMMSYITKPLRDQLARAFRDN